MKIQVADLSTWLFPDLPVERECSHICLDAPKNSDATFQILTDLTCKEGTSFSWSSAVPEDGIGIRVYQLLPVRVSHNSDVKHHESQNYDEVKDFVIRKAPYEIFDRVAAVRDNCLEEGRCAFLVRVDVEKEVAAGTYPLEIALTVGEEKATVSAELCVHNVTLSDVEDTCFSMTHWIYPATLAKIHGVERGSEEYYRLFEEYLCDLKDMRNNMFQLPTAFPVKDEEGRIVDFDFSECDRIAQICVKLGYPVIYGGFVSRFKKWDEPDYYFVWDMELPVESVEGYRQLKLYFDGVKKFIARNGLEKRYMQGLVDEPQVPNSLAYKALCCTFRTLVPGVKIIDPVETPDIAGSCDIWVIKQAVYEKYKEKYQQLAALGEEFMIYSCGFPANKWMNHILDLPTSATRLITWMAVRYGMTGFLHYGYNSFHNGMDTLREANGPIQFRGDMRYFPPGNHALIYADEKHFDSSVRAHIQRTAAAEAELLMRLRKTDEAAANAIVDGVCTDFETYTTEPLKVEGARKAVLVALAEKNA